MSGLSLHKSMNWKIIIKSHYSTYIFCCRVLKFSWGHDFIIPFDVTYVKLKCLFCTKCCGLIEQIIILNIFSVIHKRLKTMKHMPRGKGPLPFINLRTATISFQFQHLKEREKIHSLIISLFPDAEMI